MSIKINSAEIQRELCTSIRGVQRGASDSVSKRTEHRVDKQGSWDYMFNEVQKRGFQPEGCIEMRQRPEEIGIDWGVEFAEVIRPVLKRARVYVTEEFQIAASTMVKAINGSMDEIGIARLDTEEPYFPKQSINGKVHSKLASKPGYNVFAICQTVDIPFWNRSITKKFSLTGNCSARRSVLPWENRWVSPETVIEDTSRRRPKIRVGTRLST